MADDEDEKEDNKRGGQCHTNSNECIKIYPKIFFILSQISLYRASKNIYPVIF